MAIFAVDTSLTTTPPSTTTQLPLPNTTSATTPTAITTSADSITFSSPDPSTALFPDQNLTISGTINPAPTLPATVLIQVGPQGSLIPLLAATVAVGTNGTFWYSALVGYTWEMTGIVQVTFVITATDSTGATGVDTFMVALPTC